MYSDGFTEKFGRPSFGDNSGRSEYNRQDQAIPAYAGDFHRRRALLQIDKALTIQWIEKLEK